MYEINGRILLENAEITPKKMLLLKRYIELILDRIVTR